jgi:hypothetical protein
MLKRMLRKLAPKNPDAMINPEPGAILGRRWKLRP